MRRILMVCNHFAPDATIAAVRTTKLAKYLRNHGYEVTFLAEKKAKGGFDGILAKDASGIEVVYAENSDNFLRFLELYKKWIKPYKEKRLSDLSSRKRVNRKTGHVEFYPFETAYPVLGSMEYVVEWIRQRNLFQSVKDFLRKNDGFDYLFTSYGDAFSWFCGCYYKKVHEDVPWHFDIRDVIYRYKFVPDYVNFIPKLMERFSWKRADVITGVSEAICLRVSKKYSKKVYMLTNGYDREDFHFEDDGIMELDNGRLNFSYTGSMYGGLQDLTYIFKAVGELVGEGIMFSSNIRFHYAGNPSAYVIFLSQAKAAGLEESCVYLGRLPRIDSLKLQKTSDILLLASYDYEQNRGDVITGKIFEYMASGRPIVAAVTGDVENSGVAEIIRRANIGFAYEEAHHESDFPKLKSYIRHQYESKMEGKPLEYVPDREYVEQYDYDNIGERLVSIIRHEFDEKELEE